MTVRKQHPFRTTDAEWASVVEMAEAKGLSAQAFLLDLVYQAHAQFKESSVCPATPLVYMIVCPKCHASIKIQTSQIGEVIRCPTRTCGHKLLASPYSKSQSSAP